ncbi:MAG: hypothetical protein CVT72_08100 [Alphaproteobacteria bacterium HGW-Alphaproteobacteria-11]|nr:MAG: hypothetical protein CVT72_08100 [Alphaproteobacteria bacterium HGW-Alphaproteobacteria-11]
MKKLFSAAVIAGAMALTPAIFASAPAVAYEAAEVDALQEQVEALIVEFADDADGLAAAIEALVVGAADPEAAAAAVIAASTNPKSAAAQQALANNPDLKASAGNGLGTAVAMIGIANPAAAANMQAQVEASGDTLLQASVSQGTSTRTASIQQQQQQQQQQPGQQDSTPETPASPS